MMITNFQVCGYNIENVKKFKMYFHNVPLKIGPLFN